MSRYELLRPAAFLGISWLMLVAIGSCERRDDGRLFRKKDGPPSSVLLDLELVESYSISLFAPDPATKLDYTVRKNDAPEITKLLSEAYLVEKRYDVIKMMIPGELTLTYRDGKQRTLSLATVPDGGGWIGGQNFTLQFSCTFADVERVLRAAKPKAPGGTP